MFVVHTVERTHVHRVESSVVCPTLLLGSKQESFFVKNGGPEFTLETCSLNDSHVSERVYLSEFKNPASVCACVRVRVHVTAARAYQGIRLQLYRNMSFSTS